MEALKLELRDPLAWVRVIGFVPRELEGGLELCCVVASSAILVSEAQDRK